MSANIGASTLPCSATSTNRLGPQAWVMRSRLRPGVITEISFETSAVTKILLETWGGDQDLV